MEITTIKLTKKTKERLAKLRLYKSETYEEIIQTMLDILNLCRSEPDRARARLVALDNARNYLHRDIKSLNAELFATPQRNPRSS